MNYVRLLIVTAGLDEVWWAGWQAARAQVAAAGIVLQRLERPDHPDGPRAVGVGFQEHLQWFGPIDDEPRRQLVVEYAQALLGAAAPALLPPALAALAQAQTPAPGSAAGAPAGLVVLSHADTDLLVVEHARAQFPAGFPAVSGHSLVGLADAEALSALVGERRSPRTLVIVRIHGAASAVAGLDELVTRANAEGWHLAAISGIELGLTSLPRSAGVPPDLIEDLTAYFMAGGTANIGQALRRGAAHLGFPFEWQALRTMPAHGLYHPDLLVTERAEWAAYRPPGALAIVLFYRAHVLSGNLEFVDRLVRALSARGLAAVGVFTSSLRDRDALGVPLALSQLDEYPQVIVNTVSFPVFAASSLDNTPADATLAAFCAVGAPLLQAICCGTPRAVWQDSARGLTPLEAALNIALPECDGRLITVPISFKENHRYVPDIERIDRVAGLAQRMTVLREKPNAAKRLAIVLNNQGGKAQSLGGAVGLDTPASLWQWLLDLRTAGYTVGELPVSPAALMAQLIAQGGYDEKNPLAVGRAWRLPRARYAAWFAAQSAGFRQPLSEMWGTPTTAGPTLAAPFWRSNRAAAQSSPFLLLHEPHTDDTDYLFCGLAFGNVLVGVQPPRGFGVGVDAMYHSPDLPPCHHYAAFYRGLDEVWQADAIIHFGTHGTLEWLPGKSVALSGDCAPDVLLGDLPLIHPFVMNNPGEGAQAKRRTHAVIIDHLVPPLTHAENYGPLAALARLVEEYYQAEVLDTPKLPVLRAQIWELVRTAQLDQDLKELRSERHGDHQHGWDERVDDHGVPLGLGKLSGRGFAHLLEDLDAYLCDLGRAQIRGGLHRLGAPPAGVALVDMVFAIVRSANGGVPSLVDCVTLACGIEPHQLRLAQGRWTGEVPPAVALAPTASLTVGQLRQALDDLARRLLTELGHADFSGAAVSGVLERGLGQARSAADCVGLAGVLDFVCARVVPDLRRTTDETTQMLAALEARYVPPGPSGAPTRGMAHVLPSGRNFYTTDPRGLPTPAAWAVGVALATAVTARYFASEQRWPERVALSVWGTPTLRTGGDDIAQALALLGVRPLWQAETRRTCGLEVIPLAELGRPRVDVTLRVSGFFRDAFGELMWFFDAAVQRVMHLDEPPQLNFVRKHFLADQAALQAAGFAPARAHSEAAFRVFSNQPGAYGSGLMPLMERATWHTNEELSAAVLHAGGWAYSAASPAGSAAQDAFRRRLTDTDLVLQNQDNREQDLFDSNDYFEFQGGLINAVTAISAAAPRAYVGDSTDPERPAVRTLQGEAWRVFRARVVNPKWLSAMQAHGYRGGLEMAASVDAVLGFAATTGIITDWMFEGIAENYASGAARRFLERENPWALHAIVERLLEAEQRGLWRPRAATLAALRASFLDSETLLEEVAENPS